MMMLELNKLKRIKKKRKRVGRGGSRGGTSTRGHKGQNARSGGGTYVGHEGGQMPLHRRLPKRGFSGKRFEIVTYEINLGSIERSFQDGEMVTIAAMEKKNILKIKKGLRSKKYKVKVLGHGDFNKKVVIQAHAFSKGAEQKIKNFGGSVEYIHEA
ncbi:MAG: 50S ribosomal protein L15 [Candidatus Babeliales bacterium]